MNIIERMIRNIDAQYIYGGNYSEEHSIAILVGDIAIKALV